MLSCKTVNNSSALHRVRADETCLENCVPLLWPCVQRLVERCVHAFCAVDLCREKDAQPFRAEDLEQDAEHVDHALHAVVTCFLHVRFYRRYEAFVKLRMRPHRLATPLELCWWDLRRELAALQSKGPQQILNRLAILVHLLIDLLQKYLDG